MDIRIGNVHILGGIKLIAKGKRPKCNLCLSPISLGEHGVMIKSLGEYKREFHHKCLVEMLETIKGKS
jgi:hypothetical protein